MSGARWSVIVLAFVPGIWAMAQEPTEKKPVEPLKVAPRAYFVAHCQRCHGVDGTNFVPGFAEGKPAEKLKADIVRMADGPGGASLKPEDVDAQMAYHQLISSGHPFVSWTGQKGSVLSGEVSDGAKLESNLGKVEIDDDFNWTLTLPADSDFSKVVLTATLEKKTTRFVPAESAFSKPEKPKGEPKVP